jgi:hypothetical protein
MLAAFNFARGQSMCIPVLVVGVLVSLSFSLSDPWFNGSDHDGMGGMV